jgi:hypothetical protein
MNVNVISSLDYIERKGMLAYKIGDDLRIMQGNFRLSLDGRNVEARRIRGRNRWSLCSIESVHIFNEVK